MERLTKRIGNSVAYSELNSNNSDGCYEMMNNCLHKLADYEDVEEQGLLLRLPCKVGDTVWYIDEDDDDYPLEFIITKIDVEENPSKEQIKEINEEISFENVEANGGSIAFAIFLHTSRANVALDIIAE